ncbi:MAG: hypothetical protein LBC74_09005, partial [Planctomycetaceae bacterium]|nr:hypothetical protein [Planctomycetaceae bacterium]
MKNCQEIISFAGYDGGTEVGLVGAFRSGGCSRLLSEVPGQINKNQSTSTKYTFVLRGAYWRVTQYAENSYDIKISYGAESAVNLFFGHVANLDFLAAAGYVIATERIVRLDLQVTLPISLNPIVELLRLNQYVCRSRKI